MKTIQTRVPKRKQDTHTHTAHIEKHREKEREHHPYIDFPYVYASYYVFDGVKQQYKTLKTHILMPPRVFSLLLFFNIFLFVFFIENF